MHDLIQEIGWEIGRKECKANPGKHSRLKDFEEVYEVLKNNKVREQCLMFSLQMIFVQIAASLMPFNFCYELVLFFRELMLLKA